MTKARDLASGGFGLVLMKPSSVVNGTDNGKGTVSFSAASSVSLNDVFSATYDNYLMVGYVTGVETERNLDFRWRVSGSDNSSSSYNYQRLLSFSTSTDSGRATGQTAGRVISLSGSVASPFRMDIYRPFAASRTAAVSTGIFRLNTSITQSITSNNFDATTSFTGITLIPAADTITGSVSVYGYNN